MRTSLVACLLFSAAGAAHAQYTVTFPLGSVDARTIGGAIDQQNSTSFSGFNLSATMGGALGTAVFERPPNRLHVNASARGFRDRNNVQSDGAGYSGVGFTTPQGQYVSLNRTIVDPGLSGSITASFRNETTNALIQTSGYLAPGQYSVFTIAQASSGTYSGDVSLTFAQANTLCQYAQAVGNGTFTGTTLNAISTGGAGASCGTASNSPAVWYRYTAPRAGTLSISTCGSSYDTVLSVYSATSCPTLGQQIACNDDAGGLGCSGLDSRVSINVVAGAIYYVRVSGYNGASGDYVLNIGPDNDQCHFATVLTETGRYAFDNTFADTDGASTAECSQGTGDQQVNGDLWYSFTPPTNGYLSFYTCDDTSWDTKLALYRGEVCLGEGQILACVDDNCGGAPLRQSAVSVPCVKNVPYYCRVGGYLTARGPGVLTMLYAPACRADFNNDGFMDFFDYDTFVNCYETGDCPEGTSADYNNDGFADFFDYDEFVGDFEQGGC